MDSGEVEERRGVEARRERLKLHRRWAIRGRIRGKEALRSNGGLCGDRPKIVRASGDSTIDSGISTTLVRRFSVNGERRGHTRDLAA